MKPNRRQVLYAAFIISVVLVAWTAWQDTHNEEVVVTRNKAVPQRRDDAKSGNLPNAKNGFFHPAGVANRDPLIEASVDPFAIVNFTPPPPVAAPPPPPPKPTAPPFPYRYFGRMVDIDGAKTTYLQRGDGLVAIKAHQVLDGTYRIDSMNDQQIVITYLPLDEKNTLTLQSAEQ